MTSPEQPTATTPPHTDAEAVKAVVRLNTEQVQGQGDFALFDELFADDFVDHTPQPGTTPDKAGVRVLYNRLRQAFPDFRPEIHWQTVDADIVTTFKTYHGTHLGDFLGIAPTGKRVEVPLIVVVRFREGKLAHEHIYWDQASVLVQLGLIDAATLPVVGIDSARKALDPNLPSNELIARAEARRE